MFAQERQNAIKKIVRKHQRLSFAELQDLVKVSPATLRRDLTDLEKTGEIIRVHGGVLDPAYVRTEVSFDERLLRNHAAKKAIASRAAALVPSGFSVFVDAGSTCLEAGRVLLSRQDVRVISHSVALTAISLHGQADFLCIGGELRRVSGALVGGGALGALSRLRVDLAFLGASGMTREGCSTTELSEAEMKRAILERSARRVLLADVTKWPESSTVQFATWPEIHDLVTDQELPPKDAKALRQSGVALHVAAS